MAANIFPLKFKTLLKKRQKYLFRSLYTKEKRPSFDGRFSFPLALEVWIRPCCCTLRAQQWVRTRHASVSSALKPENSRLSEQGRTEQSAQK